MLKRVLNLVAIVAMLLGTAAGLLADSFVAWLVACAFSVVALSAKFVLPSGAVALLGGLFTAGACVICGFFSAVFPESDIIMIGYGIGAVCGLMIFSIGVELADREMGIPPGRFLRRFA
ncbi:MAG: hypothetical protein Q7T01_02935 [bacterium]|nr:hypothetical protein [bacterium]